MLTAIWAQNEFGQIAIQGAPGLPWHCPADLRHFQRETMDHVLVVGRTTFRTLPVLPGRRFIVLTHRPHELVDGPNRKSILAVVDSPAVAAATAYLHDLNPLCIGGAATYEAMLPYCGYATVTQLTVGRLIYHALHAPELPKEKWCEDEREKLEPGVIHVGRDNPEVIRYHRRTPELA